MGYMEICNVSSQCTTLQIINWQSNVKLQYLLIPLLKFDGKFNFRIKNQ